VLVFGGTVTWQIRSILQAEFPGLKAIEALAVVLPLFLLTFSAIYYELARTRGHVFTEPVNKVDAVYFTVTVFATVGFGDIAPVSQTARIIATVQMLADLVVLGVLLRAIVSVVRLAREHRAQPSVTTPPDTPSSAGDQT
jgi:voltage-gated potassium channel